mmetsp:Transcript_28284/g.42771  ORF Transcript_28284/g.42771 Transcript_28284/m.42771 type:complete len:106 (+) Transcript_28284:937-1254(+)
MDAVLVMLKLKIEYAALALLLLLQQSVNGRRREGIPSFAYPQKILNLSDISECLMGNDFDGFQRCIKSSTFVSFDAVCSGRSFSSFYRKTNYHPPEAIHALRNNV